MNLQALYIMASAAALCIPICGTANAAPLSRLRALSLLETEHAGAPFDGFQLFEQSRIDKSDVSSTCAGVLAKTIDCHDYVAGLGEPTYHGSLEDEELTDAICSTTCKNALTTTQRQIEGACAGTPELSPGLPVLSLIESIMSGWNETCLRDKETGQYCNDILASWEDHDDIKDMPEAELCSYCFGAKLRMMQASAYSVYDDLFANMLKFVNKGKPSNCSDKEAFLRKHQLTTRPECGVEGPTAPPPLGQPDDAIEGTPCDSGKTYTSQDGDTCDSISQAHSVSAATLYFLNPDLIDCNSIKKGQRLCLPEPCETIHIVKEGQTCTDIERQLRMSRLEIVEWNLILDYRCSKVWADDPFWGRTICVSPPGGKFEDGGGGSGNDKDNLGGEGGSGNGYSNMLAELPDGPIATNTTLYCGYWVQATGNNEGDCSRLLVSTTAAIPINLFLKVNPSLQTTHQCDENLKDGTWYCLMPFHEWELMEQNAKQMKEDREL